MVGSSSDWRQFFYCYISTSPKRNWQRLHFFPAGKLNWFTFEISTSLPRWRTGFSGSSCSVNLRMIPPYEGTPKVLNKLLTRWASWNVSFEYHFGLLPVCTKYFLRVASLRTAFLRYAFCVLPLCVMPFLVLPLYVIPFCVLPFSVMPFSAWYLSDGCFA